MKLTFLTFILGIMYLVACNNQPTNISGKTETIKVSYVNWACDCADFIETKYFKDKPDYETKEEDCIYIEPSNPILKIPEEFYSKGHFENYLKLTGQFYIDKGIPNSYDRKTPEKPRHARVFRYDNFEIISNKANSDKDKNTNNTFDLIGGTWVHDQDSLATITISNNEWTFNYKGEKSEGNDKYKITLKDKLPEFVKETEKVEFLILTSRTDTMYYEILGLSDKVLSLIHYPTGRRHLYNKR